MVEVNLLAPILLARAAMPDLRESRDSMIANVSSGIALVGVPFYTTYPGATDTPMMTSSRAGPDPGFVREPAEAVARAIVEGIESDSLQVTRGGEVREAMIAQNLADPLSVDDRFTSLKPKLAEAETISHFDDTNGGSHVGCAGRGL